MTDTRYRNRPAEVEAVQWTGDNAAALRAFCGPDFDTIEPEYRVEDPDETAAVREYAHGTWLGLKHGDWVLKSEEGFTATSDEAFRAVWEPAPVVVPAADRAAPAEAVCRFEEGCHRVAVCEPVCGMPWPATDWTVEEHRLGLSDALGLGTGAPWDAIHDRVTELGLPPLDQDPVAQRLGLVAEHRAAVLEKAATAVAADTGFHIRYGAAVDYAEHYAALLRRMAAGSAAVDRVAAETPPAETERRLTRVREWATSDVVTARNGFGSGYREAQRDILDLIDGPGPAVEAQPGKDTETPQPKEA